VLNVGVAGGRSVRWTVPWPGGQVDVAKGEGDIAVAGPGYHSNVTIGGLRRRLFDSLCRSGLLHRAVKVLPGNELPVVGYLVEILAK